MSRHRHKAEAGLEVNMSLIVTPFLDFTFQLLFFFVCQYRPHQVEGQWQLALPASEAAAVDEKQVDPTKGDQDPLNLSEEVTVIVRTQHDGQNDGAISEIKVQDRVNIDGKIIPDLAALAEYLKSQRAGLGNQEGIKIQADSRLKWAAVVRVADVCRQAGFVNVSFAPPPDSSVR